jgi:hypothetical protein
MQGLDDNSEKEEGLKNWSAITLFCVDKQTGVTLELASVPPEIIVMSGMLSSARSFDEKTTKLQVDVSALALELVLRFCRMVIKHNQSFPKKQLPILSYVHAEKGELLFKSDFQNRIKHLPLMIGNSVQLGNFLDELSFDPIVLYECLKVSRSLLLEPAFTVFELKWANTLYGLGLPQIEATMDPTNKEKYLRGALERTNQSHFKAEEIVQSDELVPQVALKKRKSESKEQKEEFVTEPSQLANETWLSLTKDLKPNATSLQEQIDQLDLW